MAGINQNNIESLDDDEDVDDEELLLEDEDVAVEASHISTVTGDSSKFPASSKIYRIELKPTSK